MSQAGRKNPVHCTSTGQVLLAFQDDFIIEKVIDQGLTPYSTKTITDPMKFKNLLHSIKIKGFAVSKEELHEGVVSISAPVMNRKGYTVAAISIAGPASRINERSIPKLIKQVQQAADEVTKKMKSLF